MEHIKTFIEYGIVFETINIYDNDDLFIDVGDLTFHEFGDKKGFLKNYIYWRIEWNHREIHSLTDRLKDTTRTRKDDNITIDTLNMAIIKLMKYLDNNPDNYQSGSYNVNFVKSNLKFLININKFSKFVSIKSFISLIKPDGKPAYDWNTKTHPITLMEKNQIILDMY